MLFNLPSAPDQPPSAGFAAMETVAAAAQPIDLQDLDAVDRFHRLDRFADDRLQLLHQGQFNLHCDDIFRQAVVGVVQRGPAGGGGFTAGFKP